jgi:carbon monoxide dehydrogenase subunit G
MKVDGSHLIAAPRARVWQLLNDPEVLARCIPGADRLIPDGDDSYRATLKIGIGPVRGRFEGQLTISEKNEPEAMTLDVSGRGGPGGVRARGEIALEEQGDGTLIHYQGVPQLSGRLASVGARLLSGVAKRLAGEFFEHLEREV